MSKPARPSFELACRTFTNRYTMEHVPQWAREKQHEGKYYAPHFRTDAEWYAATLFFGESELATKNICHTTGQTWPLGRWLDKPFN